ncbi:unnamed protein product [Lathyrus oleraceus]
MRKEEVMTKIVIFLYVMMIFIISKNVEVIAAIISCLEDSDCPQKFCPPPTVSRCIYDECSCVIKTIKYHDRYVFSYMNSLLRVMKG